MHNSNRKKYQLDISGLEIKEKWHFVGIFSLAELKSCNKIENEKAGSFEIDIIPVLEPASLNKSDEKINKD